MSGTENLPVTTPATKEHFESHKVSRIGKLPINIPEGVTLNVSESNMVTVKGKLGELYQQIDPEMKISVKGNILEVQSPTEDKHHRTKHGLSRALINNMVVGVSQGFELKMELVGVGYRAAAVGQQLEIYVGYSHAIVLEMPNEVKVEAVTEKRQNSIITLKSADKQLVGQIAAKIRSFRKPEPYKGKGIKFVGEVLRRKSGKAAGAK
jgi:large subunit ribosomal protein L6